MTLNVEMITIDCVDPAGLAGWWAEQFGGTAQELLADEFVVVALSEGPKLGFQRVPDPTPGKNRVHLDFRAEDVDGEVARLAAGGAAEMERHSFGDNLRWVVLTDPEGNVFCITGQ